MNNEDFRPDGRDKKQLRELVVEVGVLDRADGSARVRLGKNLAIASVFGPRELHPRHKAVADRSIVQVNYRMATFSVTDYKRSFPSRREKEISKVLTEAFESVVITKYWPRSTIDVHVQIFESDGGTRTAAAIAASAALADAGVPLRDLTGGIASGIYKDEIVLDMCGKEDMEGSGDMPLLYSPSIDEVSLFQLDGRFTFEQFVEAYETSLEASKTVVATIQEALRKQYVQVRDELGVEEEEAEEEEIVQISSQIDDDDDEETEVISAAKIPEMVETVVAEERFVEEPVETVIQEAIVESPVETVIQEAVVEEPIVESPKEEVASPEELSKDEEPEVETNNGGVFSETEIDAMFAGAEAPKSEEVTEVISEVAEEAPLIDENDEWYDKPAGLDPMEPSDDVEEDKFSLDKEKKVVEDDKEEDILRDIEYSMEDD